MNKLKSNTTLICGILAVGVPLICLIAVCLIKVSPEEKQVKYDVIELMNKRYFGLFRVVHNVKPESAEKIWDEYYESVKEWNVESIVLYYKLKDVDEGASYGLGHISRTFVNVHAPALTFNMCMRVNCDTIEDKTKYRKDLIDNELHQLREAIDKYSKELCD